MQAIAYEGYFKQGRFYASGSVIQIPEEQRVVITILGNEQTDSTKVLIFFVQKETGVMSGTQQPKFILISSKKGS